MDEITLQWVQFIKLICLSIYAFMYGFGGVKHKEIRRIYGSIFLTLSIIGISLWMGTFHWWFMFYCLLLWGATSIGYGAEKTSIKVLKRLGYGSACGVAGMCILAPNWLLVGLHIFLCILTSILLGVFNPFKDAGGARAEETCIGVFIGLLPIISV